jgi:hypothetical protein
MSNEPIMNNRQRALQLWSLLVLAAKTQTVLSYGMVAKMTGLANEHPDPLGYIAFYCMKNKLPLLSSLEVDQESGRPAADFYEKEDIEAEHRRCFVYDWLTHGVPTIEQLEEAYSNRERHKEEYKARKMTAVV